MSSKKEIDQTPDMIGDLLKRPLTRHELIYLANISHDLRRHVEMDQIIRQLLQQSEGLSLNEIQLVISCYKMNVKARVKQYKALIAAISDLQQNHKMFLLTEELRDQMKLIRKESESYCKEHIQLFKAILGTPTLQLKQEIYLQKEIAVMYSDLSNFSEKRESEYQARAQQLLKTSYAKATQNLPIFDPLRIDITLEYAELEQTLFGNDKVFYEITNKALKQAISEINEEKDDATEKHLRTFQKSRTYCGSENRLREQAIQKLGEKIQLFFAEDDSTFIDEQ